MIHPSTHLIDELRKRQFRDWVGFHPAKLSGSVPGAAESRGACYRVKEQPACRKWPADRIRVRDRAPWQPCDDACGTRGAGCRTWDSGRGWRAAGCGAWLTGLLLAMGQDPGPGGASGPGLPSRGRARSGSGADTGPGRAPRVQAAVASAPPARLDARATAAAPAPGRGATNSNRPRRTAVCASAPNAVLAENVIRAG